MSLPCSAVVFDLDGTLINSLDDLADTTNDALRAFGLPPHPVDPYRYFVGDGIETMVRRAAPPGTDEELITQITERAKQEYSANWSRKTCQYEGIADMLAGLRERNIPLMVLTNKRHDFTLEVMAHFFPDTPFARIQGSPPGGTAKPDPSLALAMAEEMGLTPDSIMFMGDTRVDMNTATNAGMIPVGALWGFRPKSELVEHGAKVLLEKPMDLFKHI